MTDMVVGNYYSFSTLAPSVLGAEYQKVRLAGVCGYEMARLHDGIDVKTQAVAAYLGADAVAAQDDVYYIFKAASGSLIVLGKSWINLATLQGASDQAVVATIATASSEDAKRIRQILALAGYDKVTTKVIDL